MKRSKVNVADIVKEVKYLRAIVDRQHEALELKEKELKKQKDDYLMNDDRNRAVTETVKAIAQSHDALSHALRYLITGNH